MCGDSERVDCRVHWKLPVSGDSERVDCLAHWELLVSGEGERVDCLAHWELPVYGDSERVDCRVHWELPVYGDSERVDCPRCHMTYSRERHTSSASYASCETRTMQVSPIPMGWHLQSPVSGCQCHQIFAIF